MVQAGTLPSCQLLLKAATPLLTAVQLCPKPADVKTFQLRKAKKAMMGVSSPSSNDDCFTVIVSITCCHTVPIKWSHQAARNKLKIPKANNCKSAFQANSVKLSLSLYIKEWKNEKETYLYDDTLY